MVASLMSRLLRAELFVLILTGSLLLASLCSLRTDLLVLRELLLPGGIRCTYRSVLVNGTSARVRT